MPKSGPWALIPVLNRVESHYVPPPPLPGGYQDFNIYTTAAPDEWTWNTTYFMYYTYPAVGSGGYGGTHSCSGSLVFQAYDSGPVTLPSYAKCAPDYRVHYNIWTLQPGSPAPPAVPSPNGSVTVTGPIGYSHTEAFPPATDYGGIIGYGHTWIFIDVVLSGLIAFPSGGSFTVTLNMVNGEQGSETVPQYEGDWFYYVPRLDSVTPPQGTTKGGTHVILTGNDFIIPNPDWEPGETPITPVVKFDGVPATDVLVVSNTQLSCNTPEHAVGSVTVSIEFPSLSYYSDDLANGYFYTGVIRAPILNAGQDRTLGPPLPTTINLIGHWDYDPPAGATVVLTWEIISGPENFESLVTVTSDGTMVAPVDFANGCPPGDYVFRISGTADDVHAVPPTSDTVVVTIPVPKPPIVGSVRVTV